MCWELQERTGALWERHSMPKRTDPAGSESVWVLQAGYFDNMPCNNNPTLLVNALVHNHISVTPGLQRSQPITRRDQTPGDHREGPKGEFSGRELDETCTSSTKTQAALQAQQASSPSWAGKACLMRAATHQLPWHIPRAAAVLHQPRMRDAGDSNGPATCTSRRQDKEGAEQSPVLPKPRWLWQCLHSPCITRKKGSHRPTFSCGPRLCKNLSLVVGRKRLDQLGTSSLRADRLCSGRPSRVEPVSEHGRTVTCRLTPPNCAVASAHRG